MLPAKTKKQDPIRPRGEGSVKRDCGGKKGEDKRVRLTLQYAGKNTNVARDVCTTGSQPAPEFVPLRGYLAQRTATTATTVATQSIYRTEGNHFPLIFPPATTPVVIAIPSVAPIPKVLRRHDSPGKLQSSFVPLPRTERLSGGGEVGGYVQSIFVFSSPAKSRIYPIHVSNSCCVFLLACTLRLIA